MVIQSFIELGYVYKAEKVHVSQMTVRRWRKYLVCTESINPANHVSVAIEIDGRHTITIADVHEVYILSTKDFYQETSNHGFYFVELKQKCIDIGPVGIPLSFL